MAVPNPTSPFLWGAGGAQLTPEQVAREREIAAALMQGGIDYSPVDHWLQGAARAAQAGVGAFKDWRAGQQEQEGRQAFQSRWDELFGGGQPTQVASVDPVAQALTATDAADSVASVPSGDTAGYIREGLLQRGLPEHVADAFLLNFQDESGLNPGINERAPLVPGSRGGYGLYQLTGPRRVAYEQFAAQRGVDPSDIDAQLDFMMQELQGPEANAAKAILSAPDTGTAAAAIVNEFLRPAEEHRARRVAQYTGGAVGGGQGGGQSPDIAALLGLASDPWANDSQRAIINSLIGQQMEQQDPRYQQQLAMGDLEMQRAQLELEQMMNPTRAPIEVGGVLLDPETFQPIFDSRQPQGQYRTLTPDEATAMGLAPGNVYQQGPDGKITDVGGSLVTVNTGGEVGTIPPGYELVTDPATGGRRLQLIEGGPAWQEAQAAEQADAAGADQQAVTADIVKQDIGRALDLLDQDPTFTTGMFGQWLGSWKGSNANRLDNLLNTVRSNVAFDRLQQMREASPTGGALGSVTENELTLLQSAIGSLERSNPEDLAFNLKRVQEIYDRVMQKASAYPNAKQFGFGPTADAPAAEGGWTDLGNGIRIRPKGQ